MDTYDIYLKHEAGNVLPVEEAIEIYKSLVQSVALCTNEYKEDEGRTLKHNSVIDAVNILARLIKSESQKRFIRFRSLGDGYTASDIEKLISGEMEQEQQSRR